MPFFDNIQESMIGTAEQMLKVMEEGVSILSGTQMNVDDGTKEDTSSPIFDHGGDDLVIGDEEDVGDMKSPLDGITEGVLGDLMKNQVCMNLMIASLDVLHFQFTSNLYYHVLASHLSILVLKAAPASVRESFDAFRSAITWNEPFIRSIIAFQILMLFCTFMVTRRSGMSSRLLLLGTMFGIVRSAEWLNKFGAKNWEQYATQNYFDEKGIFISLMLSAPILLMAFFMLISFLREAAGLLVEVKRQELKQKKSSAGKSNDNKRRSKKSSKKDD